MKSVKASAQATSVETANSCKTVIGRLDNIQRSYHLCSQENPAPEEEDIVGKLQFANLYVYA